MSERFRSTFAEINLSALDFNLRQLKTLLPPKGFLCPMVKADGYGHGDVQVAKVCQNVGAKYVGVVTVEEGIHLRTHGVTLPVLVFATFDSAGAEALVKYQLTPVVSDFEQIERLKNALHETASYPVHLKFQTGMGRLGFHPDQAPELATKLSGQSYLKVQGVCTHFAQADDLLNPEGITQKQVERFQKVTEILKSLGPMDRHYLNSAALLSKLQPAFDGARPGIAVYGALPSLPVPNPIILKPVMSIKTTVGLLQKIRKGETVSYNCTWKAERDTTVAVLPIGYADGWPRSLSNKGFALIHGKRAPIAGIVCMDYHMVDVTDIADVNTGDEVVLIGQQKNEKISLSDVSSWAGTIPYEIITRLGARVPRVYVH